MKPTDDDDLFPDERDADADKAEMAALLAGTSMPETPDQGATVRGTVLTIGAEDAFLDIGAKSEAVIARAELLGDDGELAVGPGDVVEATVLSTSDGIRLTRRIGKGAGQGREALEAAHQSGIPVDGKVAAVRKGGYDVTLPGNTRAFCPISQINNQYVDDPEVWVGQDLEFLITELKGRNVVVSRRRLLDAQQAELAAATREKLAEGAVLTGEVVRLAGFGAFVDLGGVQGLLHVSQMSHTRVSHPSEVVQVGDRVTVQVLNIDDDKGRIGLGMKQLIQNPWESVNSLLKVGGRYDGRVVRVANFGAFVEVVPGIEGLLHVSELAPGRRNVDAQRLIEPGASVRVEVQQIELERRRLKLARVDEGDPDEAQEIAPGAVLTGTVERTDRNGVFVRLGPGRTGLVPNSEMGTAQGADHGKEFPPGTRLEVEVLEVGDDGRRIRLSRKSLLARAERAGVDEYQAKQRETKRQDGGDMSAFGAALADALKNK